MIQRISDLKRDHREASRRLSVVDAPIRRWLATGALELADVRDLREAVSALDIIYQHRFASEDNELFPLARRALSVRQIREIGREMVARRTGGAHPQLP